MAKGGRPVLYAAVVARSYQGIRDHEEVRIDGWTYSPEHLRQGDKILLVDDEDNARYAMRKALKVIKADIQEANDGVSALQQLQQFLPDIVVCDINMPKMNGLDFLKAAATLDVQREIAPFIVMVTAYGSEKIAVEAMKAGAYRSRGNRSSWRGTWS